MPNDPATAGDAADASLAQWQLFFGPSLVQAARTLIDSGGVSQVRVLQNGRIITGVAGSGQRVYVQVQSDGTPPIDGECSCGEANPCVHVAAVVMAASRGTEASPASRPKAPAVLPRSAETTGDPGAPTQRLLYTIEPAGHPIGDSTNPYRACRLSVWVTQSATGNGPDRGAHPFAARASEGARDYPRYVDSEDRQLLAVLTAQQPDSPWPLSGAVGFALLQQAAASGRACWQPAPKSPGTTLQAGPARPLAFAWMVLPNGDQHLQLQTDPAVDLLLMLDPVVYIDRNTGACGPVELPYSAELLRHYWRRAAIRPEWVAAANAQLARDADRAGAENTGRFPRLRHLEIQERPLHTLTARLVLTNDLDGTPQFIYNGKPVAGNALEAAQTTVRQLDGITVHEIKRDLDTETRLCAELRRVLPETPRDGEAWLAFMMNGAPALQALGWDIVVQGNFPYRLATADDWYADLQGHQPTHTQRGRAANQPREWFDLRLGVTVDGQPVNLLPALVRYLQGTMEGETAGQHDALSLLTGEHLLIRLEDGRYLPVAVARIQRIADTLVELYDPDGLSKHESLTLPATQAGRLAQLTFEPAALSAPLNQRADGSAARADQAGGRPFTLNSDDASLLTRVAAVKSFSGIVPLSAPEHFNATLRPYQQEGLGWLQFLRRTGLGGVLADDMGLGKTVQTLAHLVIEKHEGRLRKPSLIVAPVSVLGNWQQEIRRFAPELTVLTLHGAKRRELFASVNKADVVLIGYPLLVVDSEMLLPQDFCFIILDEAQTIKNPQAKVSQVARTLRADHRLCLTGTPMENHLGELWSLFDFAQPGLLGDRHTFQRHYRTPIENGGDPGRAAALSRRIQPFLLRRTKDAVARDLPPTVQIIESIKLDDAQRDFYDAIRLGQHRRVQEAIHTQGMARSHITVLDALLKLRQVCCDPRLVKSAVNHEPSPATLAPDVPSAKLDWLRTTLPELIAEGRRILLFSQFTSMLSLIEAVVQELTIPYCLLTGETQHRTELVERFQTGQVPLFLISLKAGGTGLNLTAADTIIHYDPWWNPAVEAQATGRAHRIGQHKTVFVYKLIAQGTVEEKIMQLQADKHALVTQLYTEKNATPGGLTSEDLASLFAP
jgi:superfamily II DNA or RNA helicase